MSGLTIDQRIDLYSIPVPECGCRIWMGATSHGYASLKIGGKAVSICRLILERKFGSLPSAIMARHTCDIRCCIAEDHLIPGSTQDNTADRVRRGRSAQGEKSGMAKLSVDQVLAIRSASGPLTKIADQFGVGKSLVGYIKRRERWGHLP